MDTFFKMVLTINKRDTQKQSKLEYNNEKHTHTHIQLQDKRLGLVLENLRLTCTKIIGISMQKHNIQCMIDERRFKD